MDWKRLWPWSTPHYHEEHVPEIPQVPSRAKEIAELEERNKRALDWLNAEVFQYSNGNKKKNDGQSSNHPN